jgi:hypothetical protein
MRVCPAGGGMASSCGRLAGRVSGSGEEVWLDVEGDRRRRGPPRGDQARDRAVRAFGFVITPESVGYCENEVDYAGDMSKPIVPVLGQAVPDSKRPAEIRDRNWISSVDEAGFNSSLEQLIRALDTDLEAARAHTRWLVMALEWGLRRARAHPAAAGAVRSQRFPTCSPATPRPA